MNVTNVYLSRHEDVKELAERIGKDMGSLELLTTTDKENIVAAINEIKQAQSEIAGRIEALEEYHSTPADQGPASEYPGTGWYKTTDTGVVYNVGVPEGKTHIFEGDPKEYISVHTKEYAKLYAERAATSNLTDMSGLFNMDTAFNADISHWDTSNVTTMSGMFYGASAFNQDIGNWSVNKVTSMNGMFQKASAFNQDIGRWDTRNVSDMRRMFMDASSFNQDLSQWCVLNLSSKPSEFDMTATGWTLPRPVWGTCPRREDQA